ncbi:efflux transporter outer membrane subunit [Trinickia sp. Y13]|uniref:efflux transporter outer membrane subunit n=1 Tax=Trinickia sp. Y13 TaxID=2917807 RepID=UPI00240616BA|nr:efflux transporter outer membrane subunit [Trinickia sp. Y13]MDG0023158.1 efflux transporter outer membrane subunit [Trinickia sp. Y13]
MSILRIVHERQALGPALALAAVLALTACSLGPNGEPPAMPSPAHYGQTALPAQTAVAGGVAQQFEAGAHPVPQWWRLYRSPQLDALVDEGLKNSPTLAATERTLAGAHEQLRAQIGSSLLPTVDAGAQATRERALGIPEAGPPTVRYNVFVGQIQAHYTFDLFGAVRYANAALHARVDVQAFELDAARRALAANIVTTAITAAALSDQIEATQRLIALAQQTAREDARRYALGAAPHVQALTSEQNAAALAASLPGMLQQRQTALHALAVLIGRTPDAAPSVPSLSAIALPERVPVVVPSELLHARPDIAAAEASLKAAAAEVGVATAQLFPSLSLTASMGQGGFSWPTALSGAGALWSIGGSLSQPLFHGGALLAQRRAAIDFYEASADQYKATVLSAFQNVADTLAALEHDAQAASATEQQTQAARRAFDETAARGRLGAVAPTAVQASEQQYRNAELGAIRATGQRLIDTAALFQAMGESPERSIPQ